ncbi:YnbE family lipoprotein [Bowmanella sp. Y57]|uniref:YnbE family lipoprotein n=1 Tax=Bowmanella yangjiangensis TaxID=2811230 RepID=A0ABS3D0A4_9ALTE|nr:YnbE family lipoprotein [Bowmanella yangjiangensis]
MRCKRKCKRKSNEENAVRHLLLLTAVLMLGACTHRVQVETKEPITINLNVKVDHEIRVKVDKELDSLFSEDSELF